MSFSTTSNGGTRPFLGGKLQTDWKEGFATSLDELPPPVIHDPRPPGMVDPTTGQVHESLD